jgi:hypothetical protein
MQGGICERLIRSIVPCLIYLHYRLNIGTERRLAGWLRWA